VYPTFFTVPDFSGHTGNIFSAKFMPHTNNTKIVSCAGDRLIKLSELEYTPERHAPGSTKRTWYCHTDMTKRIVTEDNPNTFLSCSEDGISTPDRIDSR
jgi:WD40 repeat protein